MDNYKKSTIGEIVVKKHLEENGYEVEKSERNGSDLKAIKNGKCIYIEVKTSSNLKGGIPDMHDTEFKMENEKYFFVADYLYVVRLNSESKPFQLDILNKEEIDKYSDSHKKVTRIRTTKLDTDLYHKKVGQSIELS